MKTLTLLILILGVSAQEVITIKNKEEYYKKINERAKKDFLIISKFISENYVTPIKKKTLPKLKKYLSRAQQKYKKSSSKSAKKKYKNEISSLEKQIEVNENWVIYYEAFRVQNKAYFAKDDKTYNKAEQLCEKIKVRYKELTNEPFPDLMGLYIEKHGPIKY